MDSSVANTFESSLFNQHHHVLNENKRQERENIRDETFYPHSSNSHIYNQNGKDFI
jgi:hypothetical protein